MRGRLNAIERLGFRLSAIEGAGCQGHSLRVKMCCDRCLDEFDELVLSVYSSFYVICCVSRMLD